MKKLILFIISMMLISSQAFAKKDKVEYDRNEFTLSAGQIGYGEFFGVFAELFSLGNYSLDETGISYPIAAVQYIRYVNNRPWSGRLGVGAQVSYQYFGSRSSDFNPMQFIAVMPVLKVYMFAREHVGIYGKIGAGIALAHTSAEKEKGQLIPAANASFGVDAGGPRLKGFLELGAGSQGMLCVGIKYSF